MYMNADSSTLGRPGPNVILVIHPYEIIRHSIAQLIAPHWPAARVVEASSTDLEEIKRSHDDGATISNSQIATVLFIVSAQQQSRAIDAASIVARFPGIPVILLSALDEQEAAFDAIRKGARGYLSGVMTVEQVVEAIRLVQAGGVFIAPAPCLEASMEPRNRPVPHFAPPGAQKRQPVDASVLTPRETEVLQHLREGKPNKIIAHELGMSENTVKVHVGRIFKKLGAPNRTVVACQSDIFASNNSIPQDPEAMGDSRRTGATGGNPSPRAETASANAEQDPSPRRRHHGDPLLGREPTET